MPTTRHCNYCPHPGSDCCIRVQRDSEGGRHIYAHQVCAAIRGMRPLYVLIEELPHIGAAR
ncbi:hypothetical protein ACFU3J_15940 [Streptomyces sp. NPDC057411]|uniref:hypothetical protein n=1 Tax=unclassified Streptomyces TaxID=2593676 RepID=UPI003625548C